MKLELDSYEIESRSDQELLESETIYPSKGNLLLVNFESDDTNILNQFGFLRRGDEKVHGWKCGAGIQSN